MNQKFECNNLLADYLREMVRLRRLYFMLRGKNDAAGQVRKEMEGQEKGLEQFLNARKETGYEQPTLFAK